MTFPFMGVAVPCGGTEPLKCSAHLRGELHLAPLQAYHFCCFCCSSPVGGGPQELIVVTIIVAADGAWKLPKIQSRSDLKAALAKLGSVSPDDLLAVEVSAGGPRVT